jgi:hypothetical protein
MKLMILIFDPHRGQVSGSVSYTRWIKAAQVLRCGAWDSLCDVGFHWGQTWFSVFSASVDSARSIWRRYKADSSSRFLARRIKLAELSG